MEGTQEPEWLAPNTPPAPARSMAWPGRPLICLMPVHKSHTSSMQDWMRITFLTGFCSGCRRDCFLNLTRAQGELPSQELRHREGRKFDQGHTKR